MTAKLLRLRWRDQAVRIDADRRYATSLAALSRADELIAIRIPETSRSRLSSKSRSKSSSRHWRDATASSDR
jgi:hypothetical protein